MTASLALQTARVWKCIARELAARSEALLGARDEAANADDDQALGKEAERNQDEPEKYDTPGEASVSSANDEEDDKQPTDETFVRIRHFLVASKAYTALKDGLLVFAHQPHSLRISKAIGEVATGESGNTLHPEELRLVVREIS